MNQEIKNQILNKIKVYDRIVIFRHTRSDGDCVGAAAGLQQIIRCTWPKKDVRLAGTEIAPHLHFLGAEDAQIPDEFYAGALGIVVDTSTEARISTPKYKLCRELIKIDHHIAVDNYADLCWVEADRASCCEMIVDFYRTFGAELKLDTRAAACLYTGMVTDTGRFKYAAVKGETMRCAAVLLDTGFDAQKLYAHLYLKNTEDFRFTSWVYEKMQQTAHGVAYIHVDKATQEQFHLTVDQAGNCIDDLDSIRGCIAWIAFIETGDGQNSIRVRLRSRFVHVNTIAEKYRGGGHACASGATVYSRDEAAQLLRDADRHIQKYKETHEDWL